MAEIMRWEPFRDMITLRDAMDRLFEDSFFRPRALWRETNGDRTMRLSLDVYMTPEEVIIHASVPGLKPEDVQITLEGDTLTIKGEVKAPVENVDYILQERPFGHFSRTLTFNIPIQSDKAEASFENGVLTLIVPKAEAVKPKTIKVQAR
ncbi:MAG: Hsp20/alpha crystallin family protein [Anaerolineae bacterium]|nr:Hsp20/alpha crystallin family protein [Anaerolineae bacterium]